MTALAGKTAIVTGAGSGIGRATAERFAAEGARVMCVDIDLQRAQETAGAFGGVAAVADVASETDVAAMASACLDAFGRIDVLYANAGIGGPGRAGDVSLEQWNRVLSVNLTGAWLSARAVLPTMIEQRCGSVIFQASAAALVGVPAVASYAAAKGGLVSLTRQMALDYGPLGIRVNALCPGTVWTDLVAETYTARGEDDSDEVRERAALKYPLRRLGVVDDIAAAATHLASDGAAWMTGAAIAVDGGLSCV